MHPAVAFQPAVVFGLVRVEMIQHNMNFAIGGGATAISFMKSKN